MADVLGVSAQVGRADAIAMYRFINDARVRAAVALSYVVTSGQITQQDYCEQTGLSVGQVSTMKNAGDLLARCGDSATIEVGRAALSLVQGVQRSGPCPSAPPARERTRQPDPSR